MPEYVIRDGHKLAVVFMFFENGRILIEHRPRKIEKSFIPSGGVEKKDMEHGDYLAAAMKREANEELGVLPTEYHYIGDFKIKNPYGTRLWFHCFLITSWEGEIPDHTIENGEKHSDVEWIELKEHKKHMTLLSADVFCRNAIEKLEELSILG